MSDPAPLRVVATAGHVDHGKSTLVRALTGMEPDRYEEERRRGLTLDLGFVWTVLPSGRGVAFVDVPGHERLVRTMLAGVGAVDRCLFVVAANEGWMRQSEEHLRILQLVGAVDGVVALTKADTLDAAGLRDARGAVKARLRGSFLQDCAIVEVDALHRDGLATVVSALEDLLARADPVPDRGRPRLWVDRSFPIKGAGTVVTGTLGDGTLSVGDDVLAFDARGHARHARIRGLQSQEQARTSVGPGQRVAANLAGIHHEVLSRGSVLVRAGQWRPTKKLDAVLHTVPDAELRNRGAFLAYIGTGEHAARLRILDGRDRIGPGNSGAARLWLTHPVPVLPGDRFVVRDAGRGTTVAGGEVLDVRPVLSASKAHPDRCVNRLVVEHGWIESDELEALTGELALPTVGRWVVSTEALDETRARVRASVDQAGSLGIDLALFDERERAVVAVTSGLVIDRGYVRRAARLESVQTHPWLRALEASPFAPPSSDAVPRDEVRALVRHGIVVENAGCYFALTALETARQLVAAELAVRDDGITMSELRSLLGTSRKYAVPIASILDRRGVTVRRGDRRLGGRRLALPLNPQPL